MQPRSSPFFARPAAQRQRGVALFVVIVFVLLSMLLALWASRTSMFNELVVGNDADYQRAFEAAQALLQDAELDIRGERADGFACDAGDVSGMPIKVCRRGSTAQIPLATEEVGPLLAELEDISAHPTRCLDGLCFKRSGRQDFWNYTSITNPVPSNLQPGEVTLDSLMAGGVGARYGEYTGANEGLGNSVNPLLAWDSNGARAWYWIEVLPYDQSSQMSSVVVGSGANLLPLNMVPNVVYRITALSQGRKTRPPKSGEVGPQPVTVVVLQQTYARQKRKD